MSRAHLACLLFYLLYSAALHLRLPLRTARISAAANFFMRQHLNVPAHLFIQLGANPPPLRPVFQRILQPHNSPTPISTPRTDPRAKPATPAPSTPLPPATAGKSSRPRVSADQTSKFQTAAR